MPSLEELVPVLILALFALGFALERLLAARALPRVRGWWLRGGVFFLLTFAVNGAVPIGVAALLGGHTGLALSRLPGWVEVPVLLVALDLAAYALHRGQHRSTWLFRLTHQLHHAAERVDVLGAAFFHPLDIALQAALSALVVAALGSSPDAAALAGVLLVAMAVFQHLNARTPRWLGTLVQRPEGHSLHHARGIHAYNYGNLTLWDWAFGTFRNPPEFSAEAGYYPGASARVGAMLLGRDVSRP